MGAVDCRKRTPQCDPREADDPQDQPQQKARRQFTPQDGPPVAKLNFTQRERTDDQCRGLGARVAAAGYDQRDKQRQHHGLGDLVFKIAHGGGRQHFSQEQHNQPDRTLANQSQQWRFGVRGIERLETAQLLDVFCRRGFGNVQHIVNGDNSQQPAILVHDGKCRAVIASEDFNGRTLFVAGMQRNVI